jgi:hypothetical protein
MPVLDIAHETLLRAFRIVARAPRGIGRFNFGPRTLDVLTARWKFPATLRAAIARPTPAGCSSSAVPATLTAPAQVKAVRDALIAEGTIAVAETDRTGKPLAWDFTPTTPFPSMDAYRAALRALFTPQDAPPVEAPAFRSITHGEIVNLPVGTRVDTENGLHRVSLGGEWFLLLSPSGGAGLRTREVIGKVRVTPPDARALWALLMDHAYARITLAGGVEVDVDAPTELRALLDAEIQAQDQSAFARRVLAAARARTTGNTRLPAIREDAPQIYEGLGFIRATFAPLTPSMPLRHLTTPTPAPVVVPVGAPAPPRIHTLTTTTWMITDESRPFAARYAGTDAISGLPFEAGAEVRSATVNGVKGYTSTSGIRLLDVRHAGDGRWTSVYTIVTPAVDTDALVARAQRIRLLKKQGGYVEYALKPYGWVSTRGARSTLPQLNRYARVAYAIFAEGLA